MRCISTKLQSTGNSSVRLAVKRTTKNKASSEPVHAHIRMGVGLHFISGRQATPNELWWISHTAEPSEQKQQLRSGICYSAHSSLVLCNRCRKQM